MGGAFLYRSFNSSSLRRQGSSFLAALSNLESWMPAFAGMTASWGLRLRRGWSSLAASSPSVLRTAPPTSWWSAMHNLARNMVNSLSALESWMPAFAGMTELWGLRLRRGWSSLDDRSPSVLRTAPPTSWWSAMYNLARNMVNSPSAQLAGGGARRAEGAMRNAR